MQSLLTDARCFAQAWDLRLGWLRELMTKLREKTWSVNALVSVMIDNCLSFGDLQKFRQALSLVYSRDHDRYMLPLWVTPPCDSHLVRPRCLRFPEPIPFFSARSVVAGRHFSSRTLASNSVTRALAALQSCL